MGGEDYRISYVTLLNLRHRCVTSANRKTKRFKGVGWGQVQWHTPIISAFRELSQEA